MRFFNIFLYRQVIFVVFVAAVTLVLGCLSGCSKTTLDKLASSTVYYELNNSFWASEHNNKSKLWDEALGYCKNHQVDNNKPNCVPVMMEYALTNGATTAPAIGHSGNVITIPNF